MLWVLAKGALGATIVLLLWVAIERAWGRIVAPTLGAPRDEHACRGCSVCSRRCEGEGAGHETRGTESEPGGSSCS